MDLNFSQASLSRDPFPHIRIPDILSPEQAAIVLAWLKERAPWSLRVESFYEQHEFSLQRTPLDLEVSDLISETFVARARDELLRRFALDGDLELVDVSAHRLTPGQTIRIHNDYIGDEETHRLLVQLNDGWSTERGGLLMLFENETPASVRHIIMPTHASGFAFEISPKSHHAVSSIKQGERYTLVYTFKRAQASPVLAGT